MISQWRFELWGTTYIFGEIFRCGITNKPMKNRSFDFSVCFSTWLEHGLVSPKTQLFLCNLKAEKTCFLGKDTCQKNIDFDAFVTPQTFRRPKQDWESGIIIIYKYTTKKCALNNADVSWSSRAFRHGVHHLRHQLPHNGSIYFVWPTTHIPLIP